jgi:hypothetical protein
VHVCVCVYIYEKGGIEYSIYIRRRKKRRKKPT